MEPELIRALTNRWPRLEGAIQAALQGDAAAESYVYTYAALLDEPQEDEGGEDEYLVDAAEACARDTMEF